MIEIRNLTFRYTDHSKPALRSIHLSIQPGESVLLTGPSGSGKSTLGMAIAAVLFNQFSGEVSGEVMVNGQDMRRTALFKAADSVGLVQQNPEAQFCTLNVQDEVAFGLENRCLAPNEIRARIEWALRVVGATHLMGRELASLSGGEKQKIAIAAVMAARPKVLILDEPTSNLDPSATRDILRVIAALRHSAGLTVIVIEHKWIDVDGGGIRQVHLTDGRVTFDGPLDSARPMWRFEKSSRPAGDTTGISGRIARVDELSVRYAERAAIEGVSLDLWRGEFVAVMGDNGSGKSTLLQALLGLVKPAHGSVEVFGSNTRTTPVSVLARTVAFVFQNPDHQLFARSVWDESVLAVENFGLLDEQVRERTEKLLTHSGLQDRLQDHPYKLSYGEKRRLNLVSTLNYDPRLILLDEILIGQDWENACFVLDAIAEKVAEGSTAVLVNHSPAVTEAYAHRLLFLERGRLLIDAPVPEAFDRLRSIGLDHYCPKRGTPATLQAKVSA